MKPRNEFQKQIVMLSKRLPKMSPTQKKWAYKHCLEHIGSRTKKGVITCLECGKSWQDESSSECVCPHCSTKLQIKDTRKRVFKQIEYFCVITVNKGFQVLRFYYVSVHRKKGERAYYFCSEVVQRWIAPNGQYVTLALLRLMSYYYYDMWFFNSNLEIRPERTLYDIPPILVYNRQCILPEIKRNGFKGAFHDLTPFTMFHSILTDNRMETLLKTGQFEIMHTMAYSPSLLDKYWTSIKICLRNGYYIADGKMWYDYLNMLQYFKKDLRNPKFICPENLKAEHDQLVEKRNKIWNRESIERERQWQELRHQRAIEQKKAKRSEMSKNERIYKKMKAKFFGIVFSDKTIEVRVLESVREFYNEGLALHHCVFTSDYFLRPNSLILSACVNGEPTETIEVSLESMNILQCRGYGNRDSPYHDRIVKLVNQNMKLIHKRMVA